MIRAFALGLRLAGVGTASARIRAAMVAVAALVGTWTLLALAAFSRAQQVELMMAYSPREITTLLLVIVASIAIPVLMLAASAGRLSASVRERRLGCLRLLGLSPSQTRIAACVESAVSCVIGVLLGAALFLATLPLLAGSHIAVLSQQATSFAPRGIDWVLVIAAMLVSTTLAVLAPVRRRQLKVVSRYRHDVRPSWWRLVPLALGLALCCLTFVVNKPDTNNLLGESLEIGGFCLLALGVITATPLLVSLFADLLVRRSAGPVWTIAGRRIQSRPAGVSQIISTLAVGLFLVTGAHAVVESIFVAVGPSAAYSSSVSDQFLTTTTASPDPESNTAIVVRTTSVAGSATTPRISGARSNITVDPSGYDLAAELRVLVWAIAVLVIAIGLLAFALGCIDRASVRRREVVSLRLAGVPAAVVRRAQWIEAAIPVLISTAVAIGCGLMAAATYLYSDYAEPMPWREYGLLIGIALAAGVLVTGLTTIASSPRLRPELIRVD